ncbi:MAG: methionyl-tRNA formyltransferase [Candidatus Doudnabacteria bacterium]|nr:methionyl-tRNA formyltransferase [Candidatus Doudnabacteria bacterium]
MKIVFFGTSNVALPILEALSRKHEIAAVVTMPDASVGRSQTLTESPVSVLANEMKLQVIKPEKVKGNEEFRQALQNFGADIFVIVSYGQILPLEIINLPKYKTINVHFSLLPKYRGPSPIQTAILNGETETGTSIFILDEQVDHGPILAQEKIVIDDDDNTLTLSEKMAFKSAQLIIPTMEDYASGAIIPKPQDDSLATHTQHIDKAHGKIDWTRTASQIYNQFRAFYPWPGIWTKWDGKVLKITDCVSDNELRQLSETAENSGKVLTGGLVACGGSSFLQIKTLQLEGKNETKILNFLNGYEEFVGSRLE